MDEENENVFDVKSYTIPELYVLLGFPDNQPDPDERAVEMRILQLVRHYSSMDNQPLSDFFTKVYAYFFDLDLADSVEEAATEEATTEEEEEATTAEESFSEVEAKPPSNLYERPTWDIYDVNDPTTTTTNDPTTTTTTTTTTEPQESTNQVVIMEYPLSNLNPIMKETVENRITIDSQSRTNQFSSSTDFTLTLEQTLRGVVKMRLDNFSIPYHWYTISSAYGSNVLYIRGNQPGINTTDFDIKIEVPPGTYTAEELCTAVRKNIATLSTAYPTIEFGGTDIVYSSTSAMVELIFNLRNAFNETHYTLTLLNGSSTQVYPNPPSGITETAHDIVRSKNLWAYLGFNDLSYDLSTVSSNLFTTDPNIPLATNNPLITLTDTHFYLIQYIPMALSTTMAQSTGVPLFDPAATTTSNIMDTIDFALPHNESFLHTLLIDINTLIKTNGKLDPAYSGIQTHYYPTETTTNEYDEKYIIYENTNPAHEYADKYILNWAFRLNRATNHIPPFSKLVLKVPKSWVSTSVGLRFSEMRVSVEHNGFVYYELNNQRAETNLPAGNYSTTPTITTPEPTGTGYEDAIIYTCDPSGNLITSGSTHRGFLTWPITLRKQENLSLTQYIAVINDAITSHATTISTISGNPILEFPVNTNIALMNADSKFELSVDIRCIYDKSYFTVTVGAGDLLTRLNFLVGEIESTITKESTFQNVSVIEVDRNNVTMCSIQLSQIGVQHLANYNGATTSLAVPVPFIHSEPVPPGTGKIPYTPSKLVEQINQSFLAFTWNTKNVFIGTTLVLQNIGNNLLKALLTLQTQLIIVEEDYTVKFRIVNNKQEVPEIIDEPLTITELQDNLKLNPLYDLKNALLRDTYRVIVGNTAISTGLVELSTATTMRFTPDGGVPGVANSGVYDLTIPAGEYTRQELYNVINDLFKENPITAGTQLYTYIDPVSGDEYAEIRWNLSKVFMAKDYSLVFYDSERFVSCFIGNKSVRNTKSNSTLGWILGYQEYTEYPLYQDAGVIDPINGFQYFEGSKNIYAYNSVSVNTIFTPSTTPSVYSDMVSIRGDTTINVNIYNNFYIIIDDYNQNHINDNVVTIADPDQQMILSYMNRKSICDPETKQRIMTGMSTEKQIGTLTQKFIYASNQIIEDQNKRIGERAIRTKGEGVYLSNVFATIPLKLSAFGQIYTGDGGSLANQNRTFFGPVNISRMNVKLVNHLGDTVDLNGQNWSMSLICDSLYQRQTAPAKK